MTRALRGFAGLWHTDLRGPAALQAANDDHAASFVDEDYRTLYQVCPRM